MGGIRKMGKDVKQFSDNRQSELSRHARNNKVAIIGYVIYIIALMGSYLFEVINGNRDVGYYAIFSVLLLMPFAIMLVMYKKKPASLYVRYVLLYGHFIFYAFTLFTTTSPVAFVYVFLIGILITNYGEIKLSFVMGIELTVIMISHVVYLGIKGDITSANLPDIKIKIAFCILYSIFIILVAKVTNKNNNEKLDEIRTEKDNVEGVLGNIISISDKMIDSIHTVSDKMGELEESVSKTMISMEEVSNGTTDTAESVQSQLIKTEEIQNFIQRVEAVSDKIKDDMEETGEEISVGKEKVEDLINQVHVSEDASNRVSSEMNKLIGYADQMQSIIEMIDGITSQTSLLSLNASIEAARVGEAGKGFAVVASEISKLAEQTQNATVDVTELIGNITLELQEVVNVVNYLMDNSKLQSVAATETASSFETIAGRTIDIKKQSEGLSELINSLAISNESIVDSIQTISAATEEVTAHSNITLECSEENNAIVSSVGETINELHDLAEQLKKINA